MRTMRIGVTIALSVIWFFSIGITKTSKPKIAIIGAGIGGSSCAHFLNEELGDTVDIDIYEANEIGGRVATVQYKGSIYETGGCVVHQRNQYMNNFREKFRLKTRPEKSGDTFGIYDGEKFDFISSRYHWMTIARMMIRYGFLSLRRLRWFVENMLTQFDRIYELQDEGQSFRSVNELFQAASHGFLSYFNVTTAEGFSSYADVNKFIVDELVKGSLRVNYGQSVDVHLFVGAVSVAGMFGSLWSVKDGNKQVPELLLKHCSIAKLLARLVTKVIYDSGKNKYHVESITSSEGDSITEIYDVVIIANPITSDSRSAIEFLNFSDPIEVLGEYQRTVVTIISGLVNGSYFGLPVNGAPDLIVNNNEIKILNSLGIIHPVDGDGKTEHEDTAEYIQSGKKDADNKTGASKRAKDTDLPVWKIFSRLPLNKIDLDAIFQKHDDPKVIDWLAYPKYENLKLSGSFVLHNKLFYVNAIEWAASAMEMSAIGAKNVALLVRNEVMKIGRKNIHKEGKTKYARAEL